MNIQPLEPADAELLKELQPPDWQDIIPYIKYYIQSQHSHPIKVVEDAKIIGIGTTVLHGDTAWLALIIVHPGHRNKGLGRLITQSLIDSIDPSHYKTIYLVATPMGEPVYAKMGFEIEGEFVFLRGEKKDFIISVNIKPFEEKYRNGIFKLDEEAYGENRHYRIAENLQNAFVYVNNDTVEGFYLPTLGEGLIVAQNDAAGIELMKLRVNTSSIPAILPVDNEAAIQFLKDNGFVQFRTAKRMRLGDIRPWQPAKIFNRVSGQIG